MTRLTNEGERNLVRHERHALANEQTRGEAHDLFEQVLQPPTQAPVWENDLLKELVLPERVNGHQVGPAEHRERPRQRVRRQLAGCRGPPLRQTRVSPKLQRHPHEPLPLPHDHSVDPGGRGEGLGGAPYHDRHCVALAAFGEEVNQTGFTDRAEAWSEEHEDIPERF